MEFTSELSRLQMEQDVEENRMEEEKKKREKDRKRQTKDPRTIEQPMTEML